MADIAKAERGADKDPHATEIERASSSPGDDAVDPKEVAVVRHRIDWRLLPPLGAMYGIALMDRNNVPNAAIAGMLVDLKLTSGSGYSEFPAN